MFLVGPAETASTIQAQVRHSHGYRLRSSLLLKFAGRPMLSEANCLFVSGACGTRKFRQSVP